MLLNMILTIAGSGGRRVKYDKTKELLLFLAYIYGPEKISLLNINQ
jgi:hypothetical protein